MSDEESEKAWARKRARELEHAAASATGQQSAAQQEGERKLSRLQTRLEAIDDDFGVQADGEDKPRATIITDQNGVMVRWTRTNAVLSGWFRGSAGEHQTASVDEAFDATYYFLMQPRRKLGRTGT